MKSDKRDLLKVLKKELQFVETGGYKNSQRAPWRPAYMFQDSRSCVNFEVSQHPKPCSECALMEMVPEDAPQAMVPCRYIPLNEEGATLDSLYRTGTQQEIEATFTEWLRGRIALLEQRRAEALRSSEHPEVHVQGKFAPSR